jgi:hypothetical protein
LKNFKYYDYNNKYKKDNYNTSFTHFNHIIIDVESIDDGPFNVELKYIDVGYDHTIDEAYKKYNIPIFMKLNLNTKI